MSADSIIYLDAARHLLDGDGFVTSVMGTVRPLVHFPPIYPAVLALFGLSGAALPAVARGLNAVLFGLNVGLIAAVVYRASGRRSAPALAAAALSFLAPGVVEIHSMAWSEPLFLSIAFSAFLLLCQFMATQNRRWLAGSGLLVGLAALTRYPGVTVLLAILIALTIAGYRSRRQRLTDLVLFALLSAVPTALWLLRNYQRAGTFTGRQPAFHPPGPIKLWIAPATVTGWIIPPEFSRSTTLLMALVTTVVFAIALWTLLPRTIQTVKLELPRREAAGGLLLTLVLYIATYLTFLAVSVTFLDANTALDVRILSPIQVCILSLACAVVAVAWGQSRAGRVISGALLALFVLSYGAQTLLWSAHAHKNGLGYTALSWRDAGVYRAAAAKAEPGVSVYSNAYDYLYFFKQTNSKPLPNVRNPFSQKPNSRLGQDLASMSAEIRKGGVVVVSKLVTFRRYMVDEDVLVARLRLVPVFSDSTGTVYVHDERLHFR